MSNERAFRGVWIPADLWLNRSLSIQEKVMLIEIDSLSKDKERGCYKKNQGFAEFFGLSKNRISEIIKSLETKGFIRIHYQRKGKEIMERNIFIIAPFDKPNPHSENCVTPFGKAGQPPSENREERGSSLRGSVEGNSIAPSTDGACKVCMGFGDNAEYYGDKCNHCSGTGKEPPANPDQQSPSKAGSEPDSNTDNRVRRTDKPNSYPDEFEWLWKHKPGRIGANPKKKAYSACKARIKSGSTWREMAEGMKRYTVHCQSEGKLNTQYVMQMATFFGPDEHFKEQWSVQQPQEYQAPGSEQTGVDAPIYTSQIKNFSSANQTEGGQQQNEKIRQGLGSLRSQLNGEAK